uniref:NADH dehydrogenase subunit 2 n=1 Tax=Araniella displicata TaxID=336630 RepID=UPI00207A2603|nr:NADH dehydrogenase subunit 2 [Araniella displicata]URW97640.1 NADH dehydrogenase subunit 2 [Araniella displicata]
MFAQSVGGFLLFYFLSFALVMGCNDWFLVWVGLEINMMSFIALIYERGALGVEMCLKYFFIQSLGSGVLMMMFYSEFKWVEYLSLVILSYKIGGGPFYFWFPSICDGLSWGSCFMLMTIQKVLPLILITFLVSMFLWVIIFSSMLIGGVGSMNQKSMKRLLAFSSIHHIGWILLGHFISNTMWMIYLMVYTLLILGVIWMLMSDKILEIGMLGKISSKWSFVLGMMSMGGMPPLLGFYLKWWMFYNIMTIDKSLLIVMLMMSVLMFYVYFRVVYFIIMGGSSTCSWGPTRMSKIKLNFDSIYILGPNVGVVVWLFNS